MTNILITMIFLIFGFKVQRPVKRLNRCRSVKYRIAAKGLACSGRRVQKRRPIKNRRRTTKF